MRIAATRQEGGTTPPSESNRNNVAIQGLMEAIAGFQKRGPFPEFARDFARQRQVYAFISKLVGRYTDRSDRFPQMRTGWPVARDGQRGRCGREGALRWPEIIHRGNSRWKTRGVAEAS